MRESLEEIVQKISEAYNEYLEKHSRGIIGALLGKHLWSISCNDFHGGFHGRILEKCLVFFL